jgi:hypothetical protein
MSQEDLKKKWLFKRSPRFFGYLFGCILATVVLLIVYLTPNSEFHAPGKLNTGHEKLKCADCHRGAEGSTRQQLQAKARYWLKLRKTDVEFGNKMVTNDTCLDCHGRPNDRHPAYRFNEPKFAKARNKTGAHRCTACHNEHMRVRIAVTNIGYCVSCHKETVVKKDPLDTPHSQLFSDGRWNTCLGCHDFHGNHKGKTAHFMKDMVSEKRIRAYFGGDTDPIYSEEKFYPAATEVRRE